MPSGIFGRWTIFVPRSPASPRRFGARWKSPINAPFRSTSLRYEYPEELGPAGRNAAGLSDAAHLEAGDRRYAGRHARADSCDCSSTSWSLIGELHYEAYFLTVLGPGALRPRPRHPLPGTRFGGQFGRLLLPGRHVGRSRADGLLFERFISRERNEAPDIDVDFEHERREEVLQYLYEKYGRERAGMTAEVSPIAPARPCATSARRWACRPTGRSPGQRHAR